MKKKFLTTTEFYKNPSQAVGFVNDGGTVYLGYKKLKQPIAVITPYTKDSEDIKSKWNEELARKRLLSLKKYSIKKNKWKSAVDFQKSVRQ